MFSSFFGRGGNQNGEVANSNGDGANSNGDPNTINNIALPSESIDASSGANGNEERRSSSESNDFYDAASSPSKSPTPNAHQQQAELLVDRTDDVVEPEPQPQPHPRMLQSQQHSQPHLLQPQRQPQMAIAGPRPRDRQQQTHSHRPSSTTIGTYKIILYDKKLPDKAAPTDTGPLSEDLFMEKLNHYCERRSSEEKEMHQMLFCNDETVDALKAYAAVAAHASQEERMPLFNIFAAKAKASNSWVPKWERTLKDTVGVNAASVLVHKKSVKGEPQIISALRSYRLLIQALPAFPDRKYGTTLVKDICRQLGEVYKFHYQTLYLTIPGYNLDAPVQRQRPAAAVPPTNDENMPPLSAGNQQIAMLPMVGGEATNNVTGAGINVQTNQLLVLPTNGSTNGADSTLHATQGLLVLQAHENQQWRAAQQQQTATHQQQINSLLASNQAKDSENKALKDNLFNLYQNQLDKAEEREKDVRTMLAGEIKKIPERVENAARRGMTPAHTKPRRQGTPPSAVKMMSFDSPPAERGKDVPNWFEDRIDPVRLDQILNPAVGEPEKLPITRTFGSSGSEQDLLQRFFAESCGFAGAGLMRDSVLVVHKAKKNENATDQHAFIFCTNCDIHSEGNDDGKDADDKKNPGTIDFNIGEELCKSAFAHTPEFLDVTITVRKLEHKHERDQVFTVLATSEGCLGEVLSCVVPAIAESFKAGKIDKLSIDTHGSQVAKVLQVDSDAVRCLVKDGLPISLTKCILNLDWQTALREVCDARGLCIELDRGKIDQEPSKLLGTNIDKKYHGNLGLKLKEMEEFPEYQLLVNGIDRNLFSFLLITKTNFPKKKHVASIVTAASKAGWTVQVGDDGGSLDQKLVFEECEISGEEFGTKFIQKILGQENVWQLETIVKGESKGLASRLETLTKRVQSNLLGSICFEDWFQGHVAPIEQQLAHLLHVCCHKKGWSLWVGEWDGKSESGFLRFYWKKESESTNRVSESYLLKLLTQWHPESVIAVVPAEMKMAASEKLGASFGGELHSEKKEEAKQESNATVTEADTGAASNDIKGTQCWAQYLPQPGSWKCKNCTTRNKPEALICVSCEVPRPVDKAAPPANVEASAASGANEGTLDDNAAFSQSKITPNGFQFLGGINNNAAYSHSKITPNGFQFSGGMNGSSIAGATTTPVVAESNLGLEATPAAKASKFDPTTKKPKAVVPAKKSGKNDVAVDGAGGDMFEFAEATSQQGDLSIVEKSKSKPVAKLQKGGSIIVSDSPRKKARGWDDAAKLDEGGSIELSNAPPTKRPRLETAADTAEDEPMAEKTTNGAEEDTIGDLAAADPEAALMAEGTNAVIRVAIVTSESVTKTCVANGKCHGIPKDDKKKKTKQAKKKSCSRPAQMSKEKKNLPLEWNAGMFACYQHLGQVSKPDTA